MYAPIDGILQACELASLAYSNPAPLALVLVLAAPQIAFALLVLRHAK